MAPFPMLLVEELGKTGAYLVYLLIGFAFGYALEISGFNHAPTLAAQFYFKNLRVLKVMFTAIIVAMVMLFASSAVGLLDYNLIWVNPTYLWSGIVGGLIMGVGFIVGGFCPGTSLVAAATLKIDGILFVLGALVGVALFGETVDSYAAFYNGSFFGRLTLMDVFNIPTGLVVVLVVLMALFMFWGGEHLERIFGKKDLTKEPKARYAGAGVLLASALLVWVIGQPTALDRWERLASEKEPALAERAYQIHPAELLTTMYDNKLKLIMLDFRNESDYNIYHIQDARRVDFSKIDEFAPDLTLNARDNTVHVVMSNDETVATEAWKLLLGNSVPNVYILDGGINGWLNTFASEDPEIIPTPIPTNEVLQYRFPGAFGSKYQSANPNPHHWQVEYEPKIKLQLKRGPSGGGCG